MRPGPLITRIALPNSPLKKSREAEAHVEKAAVPAVELQLSKGILQRAAKIVRRTLTPFLTSCPRVRFVFLYSFKEVPYVHDNAVGTHWRRHRHRALRSSGLVSPARSPPGRQT